jgi:hypothetical protein
MEGKTEGEEDDKRGKVVGPTRRLEDMFSDDDGDVPRGGSNKETKALRLQDDTGDATDDKAGDGGAGLKDSEAREDNVDALESGKGDDNIIIDDIPEPPTSLPKSAATRKRSRIESDSDDDDSPDAPASPVSSKSSKRSRVQSGSDKENKKKSESKAKKAAPALAHRVGTRSSARHASKAAPADDPPSESESIVLSVPPSPEPVRKASGKKKKAV